MVTVETALSLGALMTVTTLSVAAVGAVSTQIRLDDAAREIAVATARGDDATAHRGADLAPGGAEITVQRTADAVTVIVEYTPTAWASFGELRGRSTAFDETTLRGHS